MVRKKFSKKEVFFGTLALFFVIALLTFYIWHQTETIRLGYKMHALEEEIASIEKKIEELETEKAFLFSLERVERIARGKLKLEPPLEEQIIQVEEPSKNK